MIVDTDKNEIAFKIVYWGVGLGGKTSNLHHVYARTDPERRSEMMSIATETERSLWFSFLPHTLAPIDGRAVRLFLFCVPGSVFYDASRGLILKGVDGVVFVADTQKERFESNVESLESLATTLEGRDPPRVIQYNKRDLPNRMALADLEEALNPNRVPAYDAIASQGIGVFDTLKGCAKQILARPRTSEKGANP